MFIYFSLLFIIFFILADLSFFKFGKERKDVRNIIKAATTIVGPAGVSHFKDPNKPQKIVNTPTIHAIIAICSGPFAKRRAAAAGIIKRAVTSKTPTIFKEKAITAAINNIKIIFA